MVRQSATWLAFAAVIPVLVSCPGQENPLPIGQIDAAQGEAEARDADAAGAEARLAEEGIPWCEEGSMTACATRCMTAGKQVCHDGRWGDCVAVEVCNGLDDDCDGLVDDDLGEMECGLGECLRVIPLCEYGLPVICEPYVGAEPENYYGCDGLDNDCDGETDEEVNTLECGVGECLHWIPECEDGKRKTCDPFLGAKPGEWLGCDYLDNDCDGYTDEGVFPAPGQEGCCFPGEQTLCSADLGECTVGTMTCQGNGVWGSCSGVTPVPEACDGKDNDCDGQVDNGAPDTGEPCTPGLGECAWGETLCQDGQVVCSVSPAAETCDGLDNDCDGVTDNGLPPDEYEENGTCEQAWFIGELEGWDADAPAVADLSATILPDQPGDEDWYRVKLIDPPDLVGTGCGFGQDKECFGAIMTLTPPAAADLDLCVRHLESDKCGKEADFQDCSDFGAAGEQEELALGWEGSWFTNDTKVLFLTVLAGDQSALSCQPYVLMVKYWMACPTNGLCWWEAEEPE